MPQIDWQIDINTFDGFVPGFSKNSYPSFGNKGHASDMQNVDITDPNVLTQGPGLATLTAGTEVGAITTLIKGMQKISIDGTNAYAVGGNKFYQFTASAVTNAGSFPHTIDKATVTAEDAEDVVYYDGYYFYSYNHSGTAGDVGRFDGTSTFDDDYMSTVPTDAIALQGGVPHQMVVGGDDVLYIANGRYVASYSTSLATFVDQALDLPQGEVVTSLTWEHNRLYIASRKPNLVASVAAESSVYYWDTTSSSWTYQIKVPGKIGAIYARNGIVYLWYQDISMSGGLKLAYIDGNQIRDLAFYTGSLPEYYQISDFQTHLMWVSSGEIWLWGAIANDLPIKLSQYADGGFSTVGGITNVFGTPIVASTQSTSFNLAKFSGYDVNALWNTVLFDVNDAIHTSYIDRIIVLTEPILTGAQLDITLKSDYGVNTVTTPTSIAYDVTQPNKTRWVINRKGAPVETFMLNLSWANGSATNPVKVRKIIITGRHSANM